MKSGEFTNPIKMEYFQQSQTPKSANSYLGLYARLDIMLSYRYYIVYIMRHATRLRAIEATETSTHVDKYSIFTANKFEHRIVDNEFWSIVMLQDELIYGGHVSNLSNDMTHDEQLGRANSQIKFNLHIFGTKYSVYAIPRTRRSIVNSLLEIG